MTSDHRQRTTDNGRRALLRVENLSRIFRSGNEELVVFADLSFQVHRGELVALVGESGSGKTTLLNLLAALDTPTRGEVYFDGQPVNELSAVERANYRNAQIGYVWQMQYLLPEFTALENVMLPQLIAGRGFGSAGVRALDLLVEVGLANTAQRLAGELSGGEQQRVALARALANQPAVLLADEPTGDLDHRTAERIVDLLQRLHRMHGLTSVLATHNLALAERADRTLRLENGQLSVKSYV